MGEWRQMLICFIYLQVQMHSYQCLNNYYHFQYYLHRPSCSMDQDQVVPTQQKSSRRVGSCVRYAKNSKATKGLSKKCEWDRKHLQQVEKLRNAMVETIQQNEVLRFRVSQLESLLVVMQQRIEGMQKSRAYQPRHLRQQQSNEIHLKRSRSI